MEGEDKMTDERYVYNLDIKDRKRTASGARAKKGGSKSRRCPLPSDTLTKAQRQKLNGSVESIKLNMPMDYARLKELTPQLRFLYLDHLVSVYKARRVDLCSMLGISNGTFWKLQQALPGRLIFKGQPKKSAPEWEAFMAVGYQNATTPQILPTAPHEAATAQEPSSVVSTPAVLSGSVTVRCTASHVLDALLRLIDDPSREYTFTVSFEN